MRFLDAVETDYHHIPFGWFAFEGVDLAATNDVTPIERGHYLGCLGVIFPQRGEVVHLDFRDYIARWLVTSLHLNRYGTSSADTSTSICPPSPEYLSTLGNLRLSRPSLGGEAFDDEHAALRRA